MTKAQLIAELSENTYVRLLPSPLHGIGVFAIRKIPKFCRNIFSDEEGEWQSLTYDEVEQLPTYARELIYNYCLFDEFHYFVPSHGFKKVDLSLFLNHSDEPNIRSVDDGRYFEALRDIQEGEELLIDYGSIVADAE